MNLFNKVLILFLLLFTPIIVYGNDITVCSSGCDYTTIEDAMAAATANATPPDTILVSPGTYTPSASITFKSGVVLLSTSGYADVIVVAPTADRIFSFPAGAYDIDTQIGATGKGFTFKDGAPTTGAGGAITIGTGTAANDITGTVEINNCRFTNNTVNAAGGLGGALAIYVNPATSDSVIVRNCLFDYNYLTNASGTPSGVLYFNSGGTGSSSGNYIDTCTIDHNYVSNTSGAFNGLGVALIGYGGKFNNNIITYNNYTQTGNTAPSTQVGGGLYVSNTIAWNQFNDNTVSYNRSGHGGGCFIQTLTSSVVDGLIAIGNFNGGSSRAPITFSNCGINIRNSLIAKNISTGSQSSGMYIFGVAATAEATNVENCTIFGNYNVSGTSAGQLKYRSGTTIDAPINITNTIISHPQTSMANQFDFINRTAGTGTAKVVIDCSIIYRNKGTINLPPSSFITWTDSDSSNTSQYNPAYCDTSSTWTINYSSEANSGIGTCGLIGFAGCGCGNCSGDFTAPAAINNLAITDSTFTSLTLSWTSPGDDNSTGTATSYDIRYSTSSITSANFSSAIQVEGEPTPSIAGTTQSIEITGLNYNTVYYFAIKTSDEVPNTSTISNIVNKKTKTNNDTTSPSQITNITITNTEPTGITINFLSPGDDGNSGTATSYEIRTSTSQITEQNFPSAKYFSGSGLTTPLVAGSQQNIEVWGLLATTNYYLAIRSKDELGNTSPITTITFITDAESVDLRAKLNQFAIDFPHPRLFYTDAVKNLIIAESATGSDGDGSKRDLIRQVLERGRDYYNYAQPNGSNDWQPPSGGNPYGMLCEILKGKIENNSIYIDDAKTRLLNIVTGNNWVLNLSGSYDDDDQWIIIIAYDWLRGMTTFTDEERDLFVDWVRNSYSPTILNNASNREGVFYNHETGQAAITTLMGFALWDSTLSETQKIEIEQMIREGDNRMRGVRNLSQANSANYYGGALDSKEKYMFDGGYYKGMPYGGKDFHYATYYLQAMKDFNFANYWYNYEYLTRLPEYFWRMRRPDGSVSRIMTGNIFDIDNRWYIGMSMLANHLNNNTYYQLEQDLCNYALNEEWWNYNASVNSGEDLIMPCLLWRPVTLEDNPLNSLNLYKYYGSYSETETPYFGSWAAKVFVRDDWNIKTGQNQDSWNNDTQNNLFFRFDCTDYFGDYRNFYPLALEIYYKGALLNRNGLYEKSTYSKYFYNISASVASPIVVDTTLTVRTQHEYQIKSDWYGSDFLYENPGVPTNLGDVTNGSEYDTQELPRFSAMDHPNSSTTAYHMIGKVNPSAAYYYSNSSRGIQKMEREVFKFGNYFVVRDSLRITSATGKLLKINHPLINEPVMSTGVSSTQYTKRYAKLYRRTASNNAEVITNLNGVVTAINVSDPADTVQGQYSTTTQAWSFKWTAGPAKRFQLYEVTGTDSIPLTQYVQAETSIGNYGHYPAFWNYIENYSRGSFTSTRNETYSIIATGPNQSNNYDGKITVVPLLPSNMTLRKIGGYGFEAWIDDGFGKGVNVPAAIAVLSTNGAPDSSGCNNQYEAGKWRVESTAVAGTTSEEFLHVYFVGSTSDVIESISTIDVSTSGGTPLSVGVEVNNKFIYVKSKLPLNNDTTKIVYYFNGTETLPTYITGLTAGIEYSVRKKSTDVAAASHYTSDGNGDLMFEMSGTADSVYVYKTPVNEPQVGACCALDGTCTLSGEVACTGTWSGPNTTCSPNPCPQTGSGACCLITGECYIDTEANCILISSNTYEGDGTICSPNPCPQPPATGACCASDGTCTITIQGACVGTWLGNETICSPNPCPVLRGACCRSDGSCVIRTEAFCESQGNTYNGDNTVCAPNPCTQPTGACCNFLDGTCTITTAANCDGQWNGANSSCTPNPCVIGGACCLNGECFLTIEENCTTIGGIYLGDTEPCDPTGCPIVINPGSNWNGVIKILGSNRSGSNVIIK